MSLNQKTVGLSDQSNLPEPESELRARNRFPKRIASQPARGLSGKTGPPRDALLYQSFSFFNIQRGGGSISCLKKSAVFVKNSTDVLAARFRNYESEET